MSITSNATVQTSAAAGPVAFHKLTLGNTAGDSPVSLDLATGTANAGYLEILPNSRLTSKTTERLTFSSVTMHPGALMTHSANGSSITYTLNLRVFEAFDLKAGATISAAHVGFKASYGPGSAFYRPNGVTGGGAHGGIGVWEQGGNAAYGSLTDPVTAGSGGGYTDFTTGGSGGGVIILDVSGGTVTLNGYATADGRDGGYGTFDHQAGGSAGGSVNIKAARLHGSGTVTADGGDAGHWNAGGSGSGGGAGGRIALTLSTADHSTLTLRASGGRSAECNTIVPPCGHAGTGTIYRNIAGTASLLAINANNPSFATPLTAAIVGSTSLSVASMTLSNAYLRVDDVALTIVSSAVFMGSNTLQTSNLSVTSALILSSGTTLLQEGTNTLTFGGLTLKDGALVRSVGNGSASITSAVRLSVTGNMIVESGGAIIVSERGFIGGASGANGTGTGGGTGNASRGGGGGGYGGAGGVGAGGAAGGAVYGSGQPPPALGSGGGGGNGVRGGNAGGSIELSVTGLLTVNGLLESNGGLGNGGTYGAGGGSGGRIHGSIGALAGSGIIRANGGAGGSGTTDAGGGGGAGRITGFAGFGGTVQASGGASGGGAAGAGSSALPNLPTVSAPSGSVLGTSSIAWSWSAASDALSYNVYRATDASFLSATNATSYVQTGLAPNTTYAVILAGTNGVSTGPVSSASTALYTYARAPSAFAASAIYASSAALSWSLDGNPSGTVAELGRSTDSAAYAILLTSAVIAYSDSGLVACTTYYYRVRNRNGASVFTDHAQIQFKTNVSTPNPPGSLQAQSVADSRVQLSWTHSPSSDIVAYAIFFDSGTGSLNYSAAWATVPATSTVFLTPILTSSAAYTFALRALSRCGTNDGNVSVVATAPAMPTLASVRAAIKTPESGKRIKGNRVTIVAELISGTLNDVRQIEFQVKPAASTVWSALTAANVNHPNPDLHAPFFVHWDASALADGDYDLRAVATDRSGSADAGLSAIRVTVTSHNTNYDISESVAGGGIQTSEIVNSAVAATVLSGDPNTGQLTTVVIPSNALSQTTVTVTVQNNPPSVAGASAGTLGAGVHVEITLSNGQSALSGGQTAALTLFYPDGDGDGIVDGTTLRADRLRMYYYDAGASLWVADFNSSVDLANRSVTGHTPHFSLFGLFAPSSTSPSSARVYPVPYRPNGSNPDQGVPYSAANANSGIVFDTLPAGASIRIFDLSGREVARLSADASGRAQWDARSGGSDVPSGGYFSVISGGGQTVTRKLLIHR